MTQSTEPQVLNATVSLCPVCLRQLPAQIVSRGGSVYVERDCPEHGRQSGLLEAEADWHLRKGEYDKPGNACVRQTAVNKGCPFDCGLCPDHRQHSCIGLIEITSGCDLACPLCYADSSGPGKHLSLAQVEGMLDFFVASEGGAAEILQISGGEPTQHPDLIEIIRLAKLKKIGYVMLNTNGLRLAEDPSLARELAQFRGGFEIYLQFDGLDDRVYRELRGRDLLELKRQALRNCAAAGLAVTLVCTVRAGLNDGQLAGIIDLGLKTKGVRGCNFQPAAWFGRGHRPGVGQRSSLSGILRRIADTCGGLLTMDDFVPLPCDIHRVALTYLHRQGQGFVPITRGIKIKDSLKLINNTFLFKVEDTLINSARELLNPKNCCGAMAFIRDFLHLVPPGFFLKSRAEKLDYIDANTFRISVSSFVDADNFDLESMQKECVHVITPQGKKIPFSAYNIWHRDHS